MMEEKTKAVDGQVKRHSAQRAEAEGEYQVDLVELFYRLIENLKYIVLIGILGALIAGLITIFGITPKYTATSKLYVINSNDAALNLADLQIGTYLAADYQEVFHNWHVHEMVIQKLDLPYSYGELAGMLKVSNPTDTRILYISVTAESPDEAKAIADAYAQVAREFIAVTMETEEPNLFEEGLKPSAPSYPSRTKNVALGFIMGLLVCCGFITVKFMMDDRIHTGEEMEKYLGMSTLGMMPLQHAKTLAGQANKRRKKSGRGGKKA